MNLVFNIYKLTNSFPKEEIYGLCSQMRRCAISIPSNISEGKGRSTRRDFAQFLRIALGSSNELQTQIEIAKRLNYGYEYDYISLENLLTEIIKMLNVLINKLINNNPNI